jgi:Skp family chaperone for outer membrane proteins
MLIDVSAKIFKVIKATLLVEDLLGTSTLRELSAQDSGDNVFESAVINLHNLITSSITVQTKIESLREAASWSDALRQTHDQLAQALEASLTQHAAELKKKDQALQQLEAAMAAERDQNRQLRDSQTDLVSCIEELRATKRNDHAYFAQLISTAMNDLYELKRSRLIRFGHLINAGALRKIDATINKMST